MRRTWRKAKPKLEKRFNFNHFIKTSTVFLVDENGENVGEVNTKEAIVQAQELGLDLVEVNPTAQPPVAKIMDYGQFKYQQEKKKHKQKVQQKKVDTKGIRLSARISDHDANFRQEQAKKFLSKGNKLKIELVLKGREKAYPERAREIVMNFVKGLKELSDLNIQIEQDLTKQGGRYTMVLANKKD